MRPVNPPKLKDKRKPKMKNMGVIRKKTLDQIVSNQFSSLMPVGMAIIEVLEVKYARLSISKPTTNI